MICKERAVKNFCRKKLPRFGVFLFFFVKFVKVFARKIFDSAAFTKTNSLKKNIILSLQLHAGMKFPKHSFRYDILFSHSLKFILEKKQFAKSRICHVSIFDNPLR